LHPNVLYDRIKGYYEKFINKPPENQRELMSGTSFYKSFSWESILSMIGMSSNYINTLPNEPNDFQMKDLCKKVVCDGLLLYYSHELLDNYSVPMGSYALELGEMLFGTDEFCYLP
jgi:hypothetical protein